MSRELPILFNTEMVQANLDDRKTATRRLIKPRYQGNECNFQVVTNKATGERRIDTVDADGYVCRTGIKPPYQPGDILYARETWAFAKCITCNGEYRRKGSPVNCYDYQAVEYDDGDSISDGCFIYRADHQHPERIIWRPSIHMPKAAARIWLKVTDVKPQRLQDMTLDDFLKEGIILLPEAFNDPENTYMQARSEFIQLWDSTIPKRQQDIYSWDANPWVWATEFERCEEPEREAK